MIVDMLSPPGFGVKKYVLLHAPFMWKSQNIGFLSNIDPDPLKKSQSYQASIKWSDDGPLLVVFGPSLPS